MKSLFLGSKELTDAPLVYGTLPLGPLQANLGAEEGGALIRHALERGVKWLDTAELYGTYAHVRKAIEGFAGQFRIATKTHAPDAPTARAHVEKALREMGVERLDVVHLHGARLSDPFAERAEVFEELLRLRDQGKIAAIGLSSHYISAVRKAAAHPEVDFIHPLINKNGMGILDGGAPDMAEAIAAAARAGKVVYAMKALAGGNLISEALSSLEYVRDLPGVHGVAVGMLSEKEIDANLALFSGEKPNEDRWRPLQRRKRRLKVMEAFCKGCGRCVPACASEAMSIVEGKVQVDEEACILCGYCAASCPEFIIRVV
ncbi:MAG: 4Fe-4S dicluster domain-containing protein [Desulfuromonadales bacterium]|nr:4Fe-4S dicluster domain-containing protein [Desulfuromonadales bacterium]NIS41422.1 4Fe-4S dicluster domain-containing protein [Desulfuromonadales bacterium]